MDNKIKAVFFDLDGSTVGRDLLFPSSFLSVVRRYPDRKWIITTGRGMWSVYDLKLHERFQPDTPHIYDNGGLICRIDREALVKNALSKKEKKEVLSLLPASNCVDSVYASVFPRTGFGWTSRQSPIVDYPSLVAFDSYDTFARAVMDAEITKFSVKSAADITFPRELNVVRNQSSYDVVNTMSNKGAAINFLREYFGLGAHEISFVCDDRNDMSAVGEPALSGMLTIKVGSHLPDVKADISVPAIRDVGIYLERVLSG